jgi:hypothetical protein
MKTVYITLEFKYKDKYHKLLVEQKKSAKLISVYPSSHCFDVKISSFLCKDAIHETKNEDD